jgi:hypothetical protein
LNLNTDQEGPYFFNGSQYRRPWNMPWGVVSLTTLASLASFAFNTWGFPPFEWNGTGVVANRRYKATVDFGWGSFALVGAYEFGIGTGAGAGIGRVTTVYQDTNTAPKQNTQTITFTTTAGNMTRGLSVRKTTGSGGADVAAGSTLLIEDIGPAGAPT